MDKARFPIPQQYRIFVFSNFLSNDLFSRYRIILDANDTIEWIRFVIALFIHFDNKEG
jgi:hypothetical protein